jgi:heme/copper-type cytochrome/quinol oxidase subunit 1
MDWLVRRFVKASLAWFGLGITLGAAMAVHPPLLAYRLAHVHMNLLGFVTMMIYGVAYHVIPRFTGHSLYSRRLAGAHWWIANAGLALMVAGFAIAPHTGRAPRQLLGPGAALSAAGGLAFIVNLWITIDRNEVRPATARRDGADHSVALARAGRPAASG